MTTNPDKEWDKSFDKPRLSPEEALRVVQLRNNLTEIRYLSSEYLLRRANLSNTKSEKVAWRSVWAIVVFVEHYHRFPRQGELYPYLHKVLDESKTLEDLKLPPIAFQQVMELGNCQKTVLEDLRAQVSSFQRKLESVQGILNREASRQSALAQSKNIPSNMKEHLASWAAWLRSLEAQLRI